MSGKWWKCRLCGWSNPKGVMVCNCGNSHDALVSSQFNILPGKGQQKGQGNGAWPACYPAGPGTHGYGKGVPWQQWQANGGQSGGAKGGKQQAGQGNGGKGGKQSPNFGSPVHGNVNRWNRGGKQEVHGQRPTSSVKDTSAAPSESGGGLDPKDVQNRLGTLQAVMSSIKGRSDIEATELRALTEAQISRLRVQSDSSKTMPQQIVKIQQAISKKTKALNDANSEVANLTSKLEEASAKAGAANSSL